MKKMILLSLLVGLAAIFPFVGQAQATSFVKGDVFADVGGGFIKEFQPDGTFVQALNTKHPGEGDGMAFDSSGNLYATSGFPANTVVKFDSNGNLVNANFGTGYNLHPESVVVDNTNGLVYVGQADGTGHVLKFNLNGGVVAPGSFNPGIQNRGTEMIDLEANLHTIRYISEGTTIFRYDLATSTQLTPFATGLPSTSTAYAHRILSDGGELVADTNVILRLNSAGTVVNTFTIPNTSLLFAITLDPDGKTFWTADYLNGEIFHLDISSGTVLGHFNGFTVGDPLAPGGPLGGLAVFGEITPSNPVPEPATMLLLGSGLLGLLEYGRKKIFKK